MASFTITATNVRYTATRTRLHSYGRRFARGGRRGQFYSNRDVQR